MSTKQFRLPHSLKQDAEYQIQQLLKNKIIEPASSPWQSQFFFVPKKGGLKRFVVDYRRLNEKTIRDRMPIPNIEELLDSISQSSIFLPIDVASGYWQVPLSESAKEKTAFSLSNNQYQFNLMPFGLANSPDTFQLLMMEVTKGLPFTPYLDDVIIPSQSNDEIFSFLRKFFERLKEVGFKLKPKKCKFLAK